MADGLDVASSTKKKKKKKKLVTDYKIPGHTRYPHHNLSLLVSVIQVGNNS